MQPVRDNTVIPPLTSPFDDVLWEAVKTEIQQSIDFARNEGRLNLDGDLVVVQADNRPAGKGNHTQDNPTFQLFYNFNVALGAQLGLLIRFQTNKSPFNSYSPFWIATLVFSCVVGIFREADVIYMDTDLCMFPTSFNPRLRARSSYDTLHTATDVNSPLNAGFICVLRGAQVSPRTLQTALDPTIWDQRRLLCHERLQPLLLNCTLPLAQTLLAFSTNHIWTLETWEASASVMLSTVWGVTGLDRLRPQNVEEVLLAHALFSVFGSLHWPTGARNLHAIPIVEDSNDAIRITEWARNVYEQLTLYWVTLAADTTAPGIICIHSGEGGMMVNQLMDCLPRVDLDECLQIPDLSKIFSDHLTPENWRTLMDELYIHLHCTKSTILHELAGQWHFPGTLHAYGKTKRNHKVLGAIVLSYELLCRKVYFMQHPNLVMEADSITEHYKTQLRTRGSDMCYSSPSFINAMKNQTSPFYATTRVATLMRKGWCTIRHSDSLHEHVTITSSQPQRIIIFCTGAGNKPPPQKRFQTLLSFALPEVNPLH